MSGQILRLRNESPEGLVAFPAHVPTLDQLRAEGQESAARIEQNERIINVTSRDTLGEWFDQAHRLTLARKKHGLKGAAFRRFAAEIGIRCSRAFDVERFLAEVPAMHKGDNYSLLFTQKGATVTVNGQPIGTISQPQFAEAILATFLGPKPASPRLKWELLRGHA